MLQLTAGDIQALEAHQPTDENIRVVTDEDGTKTWYPLLSERVDHQMNKAFLADWTDIVFEQAEVS